MNCVNRARSVSIALVICASPAISAVAPVSANLIQDSIRFGRYWELVESGDSTSAKSYLLALADSSSGRADEMAGFLLGWLAFQNGDFAGVPVQLDLGVPSELSDYALFLKASALESAGQVQSALNAWEALTRDSGSVLRGDALFHAAMLERSRGDFEHFQAYATSFRDISPKSENRQRLDLQAAEWLASAERHGEAVEILIGALLGIPSSDAADDIRDVLKNYASRHHFVPRQQTASEIRQELSGLDNARAYRQGLQRVHRLMQSDTGPGNAELLDLYKGLFETRLGRYRDAIQTLSVHVERYPKSVDNATACFYLGRSAYLADQDSIAIPALNEAADTYADPERSGRALELLGILYMDRGHLADAEVVFRRWESLSQGTEIHEDALWRLGWSLWELKRFGEAAVEWQRLWESDTLGVYASSSLYWSARASAYSNQGDRSRELNRELERRFPFSYYSVAASGGSNDSVISQLLDLIPPSLDSLWVTGGAHAHRFCLLTAMRLPEFALREWPAATKELAQHPDLAWWPAQLYLWSGDHIAALRIVRNELVRYVTTAGIRPGSFYSILYPLDFDPLIVAIAEKNGLDPYFIFAVICQESHYDPNAASGAGAIGLMQLTPATARTEARRIGKNYSFQKLRDPEYNLTLGISHLASLLSEYKGDTVAVLSAYNAGRDITGQWLAEFGQRPRDEFVELIPYRETRLFVKRIIEHRAAYRRLYPDVVPQTPRTSGSSSIK